jgi:hypothetical protein
MTLFLSEYNFFRQPTFLPQNVHKLRIISDAIRLKQQIKFYLRHFIHAFYVFF